ncbi:MAG: hypothetical protein HXY20_10325, partial [Acidobacteria bacterium]|nr:hypothetical protein [Acidobacteriota bacterium]
NLHYINAFTVPAGAYTLRAAIRSSEDRRLGVREQTVLTAPSVRDAIALSELLVTNRIQATEEREAAGPDVSVTLGDGRFVPHPSRRFLSSDSLFIYFQIYLPEGRELKDTDLSIGIQFIRDGSVSNRLETRKITEPQSSLPGLINFATVVPLAEFTPGEYIIQVQAIDHTARKFAFRRASFFVVESPTGAGSSR